MNMIRLLVVDDHDVVRMGLKQVFSGRVDMEVTAEARTGEEAINLVRANPYDVALVDLSLSDMSGVDVLSRTKAIRPEMAVLIVSGYPEDQYAINLLKAGASGFVAKDAPPENLVSAVVAAAQGRRYVSPRIADKLAQGLAGPAADAPSHTQLSEREFQIFCKLAAGQSVSEIAKELFLSVKTVSTYRSRILEKMNFKSNADITYYAVKNQLIA
jgi:DNA-binding NarL/FixJ family response regulator